MSGCEGGCGVRLSAEGRETVNDYTTVRPHTVQRCRLLRTLREAGEAAIGGRSGSCVVRERPGAYVVHVSVQAPWPGLLRYDVQLSVTHEMADAYRDALGELGAWAQGNLEHAIEYPHTVTHGQLGAGPVIASDPYAGRSP